MKPYRLIQATAGISFLIFSCNDPATTTTTNSGSSFVIVDETNTKKADTVNAPELVKAQADGSLWLTAENGKAEGPDIKYMPEWKAFGWFTAKDSVTWEVEVPRAGTYDAFLEWSVSDEDAGKEFLFRTNEQVLTGTVAKTGSWEIYKNEKVGSVQLREGKQLMMFKSKTTFDKGAILDFRHLKLVSSK